MNVFSRVPTARFIARLTGSAALAALMVSHPALAQSDCSPIGGQVPPDCLAPNAGLTVTMPAGDNTEMGGPALTNAATGFVISVDGTPLTGDKRLADRIRQTDLALEAADIQVTFDGLGVKPRLDLEIAGEERAFNPGDRITLQSATNYPAFLNRGEVRVIDRSARGGPRLLSVFPIDPNGTASLSLPEGDDIVAVHRVYDGRGRYDETVAVPLSRRDGRGLEDGVEDGSDMTSVRNIPVSGGAVTVHGRNVAPGATVTTLGESVRPAPDGDFVLQRILPAGDHAVDVVVRGPGASLSLTRDIEIPRSEWFHVGSADLTYGWRDDDDATTDDSYQKGRLGFYLKGKTASGLNVTASADTGEGDLDTLFRDLDRKDPRSLLLRIDPDDYYPVYGDDSTFDEDAPTSGRFYVKIEKDGNYGLWGNFRNGFRGTEYLRSERTLYGFQGHWATAAHTSGGEPRAQVTVYGAEPEHLPQRDVFLGTGGSVYFLQQQDISIGSETISVEVRDATTGRVVDRRILVYGRDYDINYVQGVITLTRPLSGTTGGGVISGSSDQVNLVAQYEWTPVGLTVSGLSYGARAETWVTDQLRLGVTGQSDEGGTADQTALGADLRWELSDDTYLAFEIANSDGPGFATSVSRDGGLLFDTNPLVAGTGQALKVEGRASLAELGMAGDGYVGFYAEDREKGFSTLDYQVADDERLWGAYGEVQASDRLRLSLKYDTYDSDSGLSETTGTAEAEWTQSDRLSYRLGIETTEETGGTRNGRRTDAGLRATVTESDALEWYVFGQATVSERGLGRNDRLGAGIVADLGRGWEVEGELSGGSRGPGGKALITRNYAEGESAWFGYELDPNRELDGYALSGEDGGKYSFGARRKLTGTVTSWGENTYDLFGLRRSLTSAYGVDYQPDDHLSFTGALEYGDVSDTVNGDFRRYGLSLGARYQDGERLAASGKLEYRRDEGQGVALGRDADTILVKSTARYQMNEAERLSFNFEGATTNSANSVSPEGDLIDASIGYALRPVTNDRLNVLFKYRFLYDMYGQKIDGSAVPGPRQRSHVLSVDAEYDLNRHWTVGGKLGLRFSDSAASATAPLQANDAWLAVATARYHIVHQWDALAEARILTLDQGGTTDLGFLGAIYRHIGDHVQLGVGYNFGRFSDDLTDLSQDDKGVFINLVASF